jgi:hypothetical protein
MRVLLNKKENFKKVMCPMPPSMTPKETATLTALPIFPASEGQIVSRL